MKLILASAVILFGVVFFLFALFPSDISVSRVTRINARKDSVARKISDLRTWSKWNELVMARSPGNTGGMIGGQADSNRLRKGNFTVYLVKATADSIITQWRDSSGRSFLGKFILTVSDEQVVLEWNLEFHIRWYPWEKLASMFYEKQLGPRMESSLLNLRKMLEPA